ncbi:MAG: sulfotransferase [Myxococcota bacterium]|nr:sulfotransferase [Myxococcota bacterium]
MTSIVFQEPEYHPVFIVSAERSGSTLLRYVLDTHARICSPGELVLGKLCNDLHLVLDRTIGRSIKKKDSSDLDPNPLRLETRRIVGGIMGAYARSQGKDIWCDKAPWNLMYLEDLERTFPEGKFICLYRNCLDVVYSCIRVSKLGFMSELAGYVCRSPGNVVAALIDSWIEKTSLLLDLEKRLPLNCHRIKYESLASAPEETLAPLLAFLGVDWDPDIVERVFRQHHDQGGGDLKIRYTSGFRRDSIGRGGDIPFWSIPPDRLEQMNKLLEMLDYPLISSDLNENPPVYVTPGTNRLIEDIEAYFVHHVPKKIALNEHLLKRALGSIRYVVQGSNTSFWRIHLRENSPEITEGDGPADCTIKVDSETLLSIANGQSSMIEEVLKNNLHIEGDVALARIAELIC